MVSQARKLWARCRAMLHTMSFESLSLIRYFDIVGNCVIGQEASDINEHCFYVDLSPETHYGVKFAYEYDITIKGA